MRIARFGADCDQTSVTIESMSSLAVSLVVWPILAMLLYGAVLSSSDVAAGGNYNLRYLSAPARRALSSFPIVGTASSKYGPDFGIRRGAEHTLYVPAAGFLWSDDMIWRQSVPRASSILPSAATEHNEIDWAEEGSHRVFFGDELAKRYTWIIEPLADGASFNRAGQLVRPNSIVRLVEPTGERSLCVIPGERVTSEAGLPHIGTDAEVQIDRLRVG